MLKCDVGLHKFNVPKHPNNPLISLNLIGLKNQLKITENYLSKRLKKLCEPTICLMPLLLLSNQNFN